MGNVNIVAERQFLQVAYAMLSLASILIIGRAGTQVWLRKPLVLPDYLLYLAYTFFLTMAICYIFIITKIYRIGDAVSGKIPPWPTLQQDITLYVRMMFITTTLFWCTLWFVKLSFLALYRNLMNGLPGIYMRIWTGVFAFCIVSLIGCVLSYLTSCAQFAASLNGETCEGQRSVRGQLASLYLTYTLDVLSDFMIIFLPMRLVWKLQRAWGQKISVLALFASGFVIIAFATIRVVQIGVRVDSRGAPAPTWLALWSMIESSVAICIGCTPAFANLYRTYYGPRTPHVSYNTHGYVRQHRSATNPTRSHADDIEMVQEIDRSKSTKKGKCWHDTEGSSLEELATDSKSIRVTTVLHQDHR